MTDTDRATLADLGPRSRVLEIGCGTGPATLLLAQLGCDVVAMDLSPDMAAITRRNLAQFPDVTVVAAAFEDWQPSKPPRRRRSSIDRHDSGQSNSGASAHPQGPELR